MLFKYNSHKSLNQMLMQPILNKNRYVHLYIIYNNIGLLITFIFHQIHCTNLRRIHVSTISNKAITWSTRSPN